MRRVIMLLLSGLVLGGCASEPKGPGPDFEGVEESADEAQGELERATE